MPSDRHQTLSEKALDTLAAMRHRFTMTDFLDAARNLGITDLRDVSSMLKYLIDARLMKPCTSESGDVNGWLRCEPERRLPRE